ncbi:hypothetical protein [Streptomyces sp. NPDC052610]|uniref:hypothetical protein n=1 Tax=Streptomyces sp. NPDC052610 TaxID=3154952 RepID=UPI00343B6975
MSSYAPRTRPEALGDPRQVPAPACDVAELLRRQFISDLPGELLGVAQDAAQLVGVPVDHRISVRQGFGGGFPCLCHPSMPST